MLGLGLNRQLLDVLGVPYAVAGRRSYAVRRPRRVWKAVMAPPAGGQVPLGWRTEPETGGECQKRPDEAPYTTPSGQLKQPYKQELATFRCKNGVFRGRHTEYVSVRAFPDGISPVFSTFRPRRGRPTCLAQLMASLQDTHPTFTPCTFALGETSAASDAAAAPCSGSNDSAPTPVARQEQLSRNDESVSSRYAQEAVTWAQTKSEISV